VAAPITTSSVHIEVCGNPSRILISETGSKMENWEKDAGLEPEMEWLGISETISNTDFEAMLASSRFMF
jgi:hypothetical protein